MPTADEKKLELYNLVVRKIGAKKLVSLTDGSPAQVVLADMFATARDSFLVAHPWSFAQRRYALVDISEPSETPDDWVTATAYVLGDLVVQGSVNYACIVAHTSGTFATDLTAEKWQRCADSDELVFTEDGISNVYAVPSGLLKVNFVSDPSAIVSIESMLINSVETKVIFSNVADLKIKYTFQNTDLRTYTPDAFNALAARLAFEVAFNLVESKTKQDALLEEYEKVRLPQAISSDSQQGSPHEAYQGEWEGARMGGGIWGRPGQQTWHPLG